MGAPPRRLWLFRLLALSLALLPFLLAETACWVFGWGDPSPRHDPFVGFSGLQPLFQLSQDGQRMQIARNRLEFFAADSFPVTKSPTTKRIFCLGGSSVQGRPYSTPTSFPTWMKLALETAAPDSNWEVVNCGGISYASYRLVPILEEVLQYDPDLIIICTGHNEFLEDRSYSHIKQLPQSTMPPLQWLLERRLVTLGSRWLHEIRENPRGSTSTELLPAEVDARLDHPGGLEAYHRDFVWQESIRLHFEFNLYRMVSLCRKANVPLLLLQPPSNLAGQPPFKSEPTSGLPADELATAQSLHEQGIRQSGENLEMAAALLQQAVAINSDDASWWYQLGQIQFLAGDLDVARESLLRARDLDVCPLRMTSPLELTLQSVARLEAVPFSNLHALLEQETSSHILGDEWLVDHVHPGFDGHRRIAVHLVELLAKQGWCTLSVADWKPAAKARFAEHFASLDPNYIHRGQRTLNNLRGWAAGLVRETPAQQEFEKRSPSKVAPVSD